MKLKSKRHNNKMTLRKSSVRKNTFQNIQTTRFYNTPSRTELEGFLVVDVIIAEPGILPYVYSDGEGGEIIQKELLDHTIFNAAFIESCNGCPFVLEHPQDDDGNFIDVTTENYSDLVKGTLFNPRIDKINGRLIGTLKIFDPEVIDLIESQELSEISQGYTCQIIEQPGTFEGEPYDVRQTNLVMNHLALVNEGRAGDSVRVLFNSKRSNNFVLDFIKKKEKGSVNMTQKEIEKLVYLRTKKLNSLTKNEKVLLQTLAGKEAVFNASKQNDNDDDDKKNALHDDDNDDKKNALHDDDDDDKKNALHDDDDNKDRENMPEVLAALQKQVENIANTLNSLIGNQVPDKNKEPGMSPEEIKEAVLNSVEADTMIVNRIARANAVYASASAVLGENVADVAARYNHNIDKFQRHVIIESDLLSEIEVKGLKKADVQAYFNAAVKTAAKLINSARTNASGEFIGSEFDDEKVTIDQLQAV